MSNVGVMCYIINQSSAKNTYRTRFSIQIWWNMIVIKVFLSWILTKRNSIWLHNQKEKCYLGHIPFNLKGNGNQVLCVYNCRLPRYIYRLSFKHVLLKRIANWHLINLFSVFAIVLMCSVCDTRNTLELLQILKTNWSNVN